MNTIRSAKHEIGTYEMRKVTLSCFDDKRHLLHDGITSYAYGNKKIGNDTDNVVIPVEPKPVKVDRIITVSSGVTESLDKVDEKWEGVVEGQSFEVYSKPKVKVTLEKEIMRVRIPRLEHIHPKDLFPAESNVCESKRKKSQC
jgi:hypothetical protein